MTKDEALHLALEALEQSQSAIASGMRHEEITAMNMTDRAIFAIKKASLEAKDEPVAWRDAAIRLGEELSSVGPNGYYDMDAKEWLDWAMEQNPRGKHSLPQRKPLTNEEIQDALEVEFLGSDLKRNWQDDLRVARAIEAAHDIKG
jgi:hypothetical protein